MKRTTYMTAIALIGFSGLAMAGPDDKKNDDKDLLRGPRVHQESPDRGDRARPHDGMDEERGEGRRGQAMQRPGARGQALREMLGAMRALKNADGELALSDEQQAQIKEITESHRAAIKAYMDEHKEEIESIRAEARGEEGERPDPEARKAAMEKIRAIMDGSPADGSAKERVLAVLSEGQQQLVKDTIQKQRDRAESRRERAAERMGERREGAREGRRERNADREGARERRKQGERPAQKEREAPMDD